jgi:hypothetical protein
MGIIHVEGDGCAALVWESVMAKQAFAPGDWVVYCKLKHSVSPGPRAKHVDPAPRGEEYTYQVDKFWVVEEVLPEGRLRVCTRQGKRHTLSADDPNLRRPSLWERIRYAKRFPSLDRTRQVNDPTNAPSRA